MAAQTQTGGPVRRFSLSGTVQAWTSAAVAAAVAVCLALVWLQHEQEASMRRYRRLLTDLREARLDLARGYLHLNLANNPASPFRREEGLARLGQAIDALREVRVDLDPELARDAGLICDLDGKTRAFCERLAAYSRAADAAARGEQEVPLRLSYYELERLAQRMDDVGQGSLHALADRLRSRFAATLAAAVAFLGLLCLGVYRVGRRQQAAVRELRASQDQLAKVVATVPGVIYSFELRPDGTMRVPFCTPAMEAFWGVRPEVLREDFAPAFARVHPDDAAHVRESIAESARALTPWRAAFRVCRPQKDMLWLEGHSMPRRETDGTVVWHGFVQDVTGRKRVDAALRESEARYRSLVETSFDWVWEVNAEGRYTYASPKVVDLLGYEPQEVLGRTPFDLMPEDEARRVGALFREIASRREPFSALENVNRHRDGRQVNLETTGVPVFGADGQLAGYRGMDRDITARKQAEEALRRSEAHLRTLVDTLPDMVWLKDPQGVYLSCNAQFATFIGRPASEVVGLTDYDFMSRELADGFRANDAAAVAAGKPRKNEEDVLFPDGSRRFLETIKTPMFDAAGSLLGVLGIARDVTERKRAELALEEDATRLAAVLDTQQEIAGADLAYADLVRLVLASLSRLGGAEGASLEVADGDEMVYEAAAGLAAPFVGFRLKIAESLSGLCMTSGELVRCDDAESDSRVDRQACQRIGLRSMILLPLRYGDRAFGVLKLMSSRAAAFAATAERPLLLMGEFLGATITRKRAEDALRRANETLEAEIAERARLESQLRQAQKLESVGRLAGGVAHDFNNLLMSIMGHTELCRDTLESGHPAGAALDEIMDAAQRSAAITRQLLAFARQQAVAPEVFDVNDRVTSTLKMLRRLIGEGVALTWRPGARRALVKMDPSQFDQLLVNLAVNARDALAGAGNVTVETEDVAFTAETCPKLEGAAPGDYVMLAVCDTGCGMARETLEHIFEPFFTTKPVGQGSGLGLATVYGIVKQSAGLIDVQSAPGQGTTFRLYLRRHEEPAEDEGPRPAVSPSAAPGGTETILLVEDEASVRSVTARFLRRLGYTVLEAEHPDEALRLMAARDGLVHLVITDVVMPGMNGREMAAKLAGLRPGLKVLLISGYPDRGSVRQEVADEGSNFLVKPFSSVVLARKVREVLERR